MPGFELHVSVIQVPKVDFQVSTRDRTDTDNIEIRAEPEAVAAGSYPSSSERDGRNELGSSSITYN